MKYINIEVKPEDLEGAETYSRTNCPVARALRRQYRLHKEGDISVGAISIKVKNKRYTTSVNLGLSISNYDLTGAFKLGTYRAFEDE